MYDLGVGLLELALHVPVCPNSVHVVGLQAKPITRADEFLPGPGEIQHLRADPLIDLLDANSEHVRLGSAKAIVEYGLSLQEAVEVQRRIESLEELYVQQRTVRFNAWREESVDA